tara:strand:+ start:196 stop:504 length:309 start_codon:yes stop_codon:yes gene_type:complete
MANQKLSTEELEQIKSIQGRMQAVKQELGQLGLAEIDLNNRKDNVKKYLTETTELETTLVTTLEDKYGKGSIDTDAGEFIPSADNTADKKQVAKKEVLPTVE